MIGLSHARAEAVPELLFQGRELFAFALQASVVREVEMEFEEADEAHGAQSMEHRAQGRQLCSVRCAPCSELQLALDLPRLIRLDDVLFLHVREVLEDDAALEAGVDLAGVVLEAAQ